MGQTHLVTFSDESMSRARELCVRSAEAHGVNTARAWSKKEFPLHIREWYPEVFTQPQDTRRAWAWWAWKPYIIADALTCALKGDILIYSDAGVEFTNNVSHIIDRMDQDIFLFGNNWEHTHWCKRDVIDAIFPPYSFTNCGGGTSLIRKQWKDFGKQVQASVIFFRVSDYTRSFVAEWLKWCLFEGGRLIDDSPSRLPNHPEFREHRHDQAILTTMAYREGIKLHYWPAMYNDGAFSYEKLPEYAGDDYPILFYHHRRRNHEWSNAA